METITAIQPDTKLPKMKDIRIYTALLLQVGTEAPEAEVLMNTIGQEVVWTRSGTGHYVATTVDGWTIDKTVVMFGNNSGAVIIQSDANWSIDEIDVFTYQNSAEEDFPLADGQLFKTPIEIRVYK